MQIEKLLDEGLPVHGIGLQNHCTFRKEREESDAVHSHGRYNPQHLCAVMDQLEKLNLPLQITEMTIPAYDNEPENEAIQAEIARNMYSLFFAQRGMEAICYWNLPDGYAHMAEPGDMTAGENYFRAGFLRFDMSEKPVYQVLRKMIREEWMTRTQITTDADGWAVLRGFHGGYTLTARADGRMVQQELKLNVKGRSGCLLTL